MNDIRYALRSFSKNPTFFIIATLILALGIGANTAIFSVVNTVLLKPLMYKDADRLVVVWGINTQNPGGPRPVSAPNFEDWKARNTVFEKMAGSTDGAFSLTGIGDPESVPGYRFDKDFFDLLGVAPLLGRTFTAEEMQEGRNRVAVLGHKLWQRKFGSDANILGRSITINGIPHTVIGVMPAGFEHPGTSEIWTPMTLTAQTAAARGVRPVRVSARLKPGATVEQAQAEMQKIAAELAKLYPDTNAAEGVQVASYRDNIAGDIRSPLLALLGAASFILLITCANLANMLLARSTTREREIGIRTALGASRWRVVRQLISESFVLAITGGTLGLIFTFLTVDLLVAIFPNNIANLSIPKVEAIQIDTRVLAFTSILSLLTALAFGLVPAFHALRFNLNERAPDQHGKRFRRVLVVSEIALTLVLLSGAGLMIRSFERVQQTSLGFDPHNVLATQVFLTGSKYPNPPAWQKFTDDVLSRLRGLPGVVSVGATNFLPLSGFWGTSAVYPEGQALPKPGEEPLADNRIATPDYFSSIGIRLVEGRNFTEMDNSTSPRVLIVNQSLAKRFWPNGQAIGRRLRLNASDPVVWWEVVGVVADVKSFGLEEVTHLDIYRPFAQAPFPLIAITMRTAAEPEALFTAMRQQIWAVDKDLPIFKQNTMTQLAAESVTLRRISVQLLAGFGALALLLAAIGTYGVMTYSVNQRMREIGIRMALGAERSSILRLIIREAGLIILFGMTIGLAASLGLTRLVSSLLYSVSATDPATYIATSTVLLVVALGAGLIPAHRATRIDPLDVLRHE